MKHTFFTVLTSSFIFLAVLSTASAETLVGSLPGDVNVDNTGEASYSIPLSLPPGTAGMAPTLGIAYSSTGGSGVLGVGFSLNGLSAVSRIPSTRLHDGVVDGIDFDELDRLALDGQRLMLISTGAYGSVDSEYRTEIDSFSKITLHDGGINDSNSWFEVRTKSGLIYEYGHTTNSFVEPEGRTAALRWAVNKISDTAGNYMTFHYSENAGEPHLLTKIEYTGNDSQSLTPYNEVEFIYEGRTDVRSGWLAGSEMISNKRLAKIEISGAVGAISDYRFVYEYNEVGFSLLKSVQQYFGNDDIPKTLFEYTAKTSSDLFEYTSGTAFVPDGATDNVYRDTSPSQVDSGDFNGDGIIDFVRLDSYNESKYSWIGIANGDGTFTYTSGTNFITEGSPENIYRSSRMQTLLPDFNGDGLSDIMSFDPGSDSEKSWIGLSNPEGSLTNGTFFTYLSDTNFIPDGAELNVYRNGDTRVMPGDFNGDGLADIVSVFPYADGDTSKKCWIGLGDGDGTFIFINGTNFIPASANYNVYRAIDMQLLTGDFNGDGLTDLASVYPYNDTQSSKCWIGLSNGDGTFDYRSGTDFIPASADYGVRRDGGTVVRTGDFNGDGLTDLVSVHKDTDSKKSWIGLSKGDGTFSYTCHTNFIPDSGTGGMYRDGVMTPFAADVNGDGLSDLVSIYPSSDETRSWIGISKGDGTFTYINGVDFIPEGALDDVYRGSDTKVSAGDFNGDGMLDFASIYPDNDASKSWIALNQNKRCFLNKVTKGYRSESEHGSVTEIEYLPITDNLIYEKGTGAKYPIYDVQAPMYVVSDLYKDNGVGDVYRSFYTYAWAKTHRDRGFLGFGRFESYDTQTQLSQVELLRQDFPHTGSQISSETYYISDPENHPDDGQLLKQVSNTYLYDRVNHCGTSTNYSTFAYVAKSVEKKWELGETDTNNTMTEVTSYNWFDKQSLTNGPIPRLIQTNETTGAVIAPGEIWYGNITKIVMDYGNGTKQISSNSYYSVDESTWLLGRLSTASVTHLDGTNSITRNSSFDYNAATGLLDQEVVEPDHETLAFTTDYDYDTFGNITNKTISALGVIARSVQNSTYDSNGRFVTESRNTMGHSETYVYDQNTGLVLSKTGPNGLTITMEYDPLGRAIRETRADGTTTTTDYAWDSTVTVSATDPANSSVTLSQTASYKTTQQSSGSAPGSVYYDNQGREIRKQGIKPDGKTKIWQDTIYNGVGQPVAVSETYFAGDTPKFGVSEFDELGRRQYVTAPDGTVTEYVYDGLTSKVIADSNHRTTGTGTPKHQTSTTIKNTQGQVLEVIDNLTNSLTYEYDAIGNLIATEDPYTNRVEMAYDILGKKIAQNDPDMGEWSYTYNALGELISQTDAKEQTTTMEYDVLGRMIQRVTADGTSRWYYDGTDEGCWIGAPRREELRDSNGDLTYRKTYVYDSLGRPMLELYNFDNKWYYNCVRYDEFSRVKFTDRFWRPKNKQGSEYNLDPEWNAFSTVNTYNSIGVITKVADSTGHTWWQIEEEDFDAKGHLLAFQLGNDTVTEKTYDPDTGFLTDITCDGVQSLQMGFDRLGNITSRRNLRQILVKETFVNDGLNRLTQTTLTSSTNSTVSTVAYDATGNILTKTGVGDYTYGQGAAGPHAVTSVDEGTNTVTYNYDTNGNMLGRYDNGQYTLTTVWNSFNKPSTVFTGSDGSEFSYDINNSRITQIIHKNGSVKKKIYIAGMEQDEEVLNPQDGRSSWQWDHKKTRIFINTPSGLVGIHVQDEYESITRKYFHADHLGSVVAVSGEKVGDTASLLAEYSYDAWGLRRNAQTWENETVDTSAIETDRGFTGHEMLDVVGLVHMNGRIYDATLGRFLSADPMIQAPGDLQSYNRYTYVSNNPLRNIDPSGYNWWSENVTKNFSKYWKVIVVIIIAIVAFFVLGPMVGGLFNLAADGLAAFVVSSAVAGFAGSFSGSLLNGGSLGDAFMAGLEGAVTAAVTAGAGKYIQSLKWISLAKKLAQGVVATAVSFAKGDSINAGFLAMTVMPSFSSAITGAGASVIGGMKFVAGAATKAFKSAVYIGKQALKLAGKIINKVWDGVKGLAKGTWKAFTDPVKNWHGNWGGSGLTAGQLKPQSALTEADKLVGAVDPRDSAYKGHDLNIAKDNHSFGDDLKLSIDLLKVSPLNKSFWVTTKWIPVPAPIEAIGWASGIPAISTGGLKNTILNWCP